MIRSEDSVQVHDPCSRVLDDLEPVEKFIRNTREDGVPVINTRCYQGMNKNFSAVLREMKRNFTLLCNLKHKSTKELLQRKRICVRMTQL